MDAIQTPIVQVMGDLILPIPGDDFARTGRGAFRSAAGGDRRRARRARIPTRMRIRTASGEAALLGAIEDKLRRDNRIDIGAAAASR